MSDGWIYASKFTGIGLALWPMAKQPSGLYLLSWDRWQLGFSAGCQHWSPASGAGLQYRQPALESYGPRVPALCCSYI